MRRKEKATKVQAVTAEQVTTSAQEGGKRSVGSIITTVILVIAVLFAIFCSYTAYTSKVGSGVPSILGIRPFSVQSDSMSPTFSKGDLVVDTKISDYSKLEEGDIITFWTVVNGQKVLNTHRIVKIEAEKNGYYFTTKGDANTMNDTLGVHSTDVVGLYRFHLKGVGSALDYLQTSQGFFLCIVLPVAIFFVFELIQFIKTLIAYNAEKVRLENEKMQGDKEEEIRKAVEAAKAEMAAKLHENKEEAKEGGTEKQEEDPDAELNRAIEAAKAEMEAKIREAIANSKKSK